MIASEVGTKLWVVLMCDRQHTKPLLDYPQIKFCAASRRNGRTKGQFCALIIITLVDVAII